MTEEIPIFRDFPVAKVIRKMGVQYGYVGHVLEVSQDVGEFAKASPWRANSDDLAVIIIQPADGGSWEGRQLKMSLDPVESALDYLSRYSPAYVGVVDID